MSDRSTTPAPSKIERIDLSWDYAVCAWARHFNTSEAEVRKAVAAVGDRADQVRAHLKARRQERPSSA